MRKRLIALVAMVLLFGCGDETRVVQQATTEFFLQDYNPENLDILWMIDDRSPLFDIRDRLIGETQKFFVRLDGSTNNYQMAFVSADMRVANGQLKPTGSPIILKKNVGTVVERTALFGSILSQIINLKTGAENKGLQSVETALRNYFVPRDGVPLVLVFISDSDDHSDLPSGVTDAVDYYSKKYLEIKAQKKNLLRVYSINYQMLKSGEVVDASTRCATRFNADIDVAGFKDIYFSLARSLGGVAGDKATGGLCGVLSDQIDLSGLQLGQPKVSFKLTGSPRAETLSLYITKEGSQVTVPTWTYDAASNSIIFAFAPADGSTIAVSYEKGR